MNSRKLHIAQNRARTALAKLTRVCASPRSTNAHVRAAHVNLDIALSNVQRVRADLAQIEAEWQLAG